MDRGRIVERGRHGSFSPSAAPIPTSPDPVRRRERVIVRSARRRATSVVIQRATEASVNNVLTDGPEVVLIIVGPRAPSQLSFCFAAEVPTTEVRGT